MKSIRTDFWFLICLFNFITLSIEIDINSQFQIFLIVLIILSNFIFFVRCLNFVLNFKTLFDTLKNILL